MAKKELISFCKPEETPPFGGVVHFKNPRYFYEHESIPAYATHFFAKDERVRKAYLKAGVEEHGVQKEERQEEEKQIAASKEPAASDESTASNEPTDSNDDSSGVSPVEDNSDLSPKQDIESMSWPELRAYASTLTDEPIKNKKVALEVIERLG